MGPTKSNKVSVKPASIRMPTEPIGSIPSPIDPIERVAQSNGEDPNLVPLYEAAISRHLERFEAKDPLNSGLGVIIEFAIARVT